MRTGVHCTCWVYTYRPDQGTWDHDRAAVRKDLAYKSQCFPQKKSFLSSSPFQSFVFLPFLSFSVLSAFLSHSTRSTQLRPLWSFLAGLHLVSQERAVASLAFPKWKTLRTSLWPRFALFICLLKLFWLFSRLSLFFSFH